MMNLVWLTASLSLLLLKLTEAIPAAQNAAVYQQPNGESTPELFLRGDEHYAWLSDANGYTVLRDESGYYVYAQRSSGGDSLESTGALVGSIEDPSSLGVEPYLIPENLDWGDEEEALRSRRKLSGMPSAILCDYEATTVNPCYLKQLALLVRFADHADRDLPASEDIDILFNHNGPTGTTIASTGSIADVYRANSFDKFVLDSHVTDWIQISKTEAYCSAGQNGFNLAQTRECWAEALELYAQTLGENGLAVFDDNDDGYIDGLSIVHSGVSAETNGNDCETGAIYSNRIWSHAVPKASIFEFLGEFNKDLGVKVGRFYVFSGILDACPPEGAGSQWLTSHIAVGVHEGGHFLGLVDMYGKPGQDYGIGNWDFMANAYGWASSSNYPGLMGAYSRHVLGWVQVVDVVHSQEVVVTSSCDSDKVYKIAHGMASDAAGEEYILIENRQACGHDVKLADGNADRQGIVIWYVDHTGILGVGSDGKEVVRYNTARAPTDDEWPAVHARVSVVQGDGSFDLENNVNKGDQFDAFRKKTGSSKIAYKISDAGVTMNDGSTKPYPNTKSIATGAEVASGVTIEVLDFSQNDMRVKITLVDADGNVVRGPTAAPTASPTATPTANPTAAPTQGEDTSLYTKTSFEKEEEEEPAPTDAPVASTSAPVASPTATPTASPTATPTASPTESSQYSCDNSYTELFQVQGVSGSMSIQWQECQYIDAATLDVTEWCNAINMFDNEPIYMLCQQECYEITGCPPPGRRYLRH